MKNRKRKNETRREFLKNFIRNVTLGGIVLVSGIIGLRKKNSAESGNLCSIDLPCRKCTKFKNCTDPKAIGSQQN